MGVRSSGPAGCIVPGLSGGTGSPGRSGSRFTQCVGISDSGSRYLTVSSLMRAILWLEQLPDERGNLRGVFDDLPPRDPDDAVAGGHQHGIAAAVLLERAALAVELPAVEFDDQ